jgi:acyl-CoA thioester hydrolase
LKPVVIAERVRYAETDQMGVAYHGAYPAWFEIGRTAYCRQKGVVYAELERQGWALVVVELKAEYKKPLRYDDAFEIHTTVAQATPRALTFEYRIVRDGVLCTEGMTRHLFVAMDSFKPASAPAEVVQKLAG